MLKIFLLQLCHPAALPIKVPKIQIVRFLQTLSIHKHTERAKGVIALALCMSMTKKKDY